VHTAWIYDASGRSEAAPALLLVTLLESRGKAYPPNATESRSVAERFKTVVAVGLNQNHPPSDSRVPFNKPGDKNMRKTFQIGLLLLSCLGVMTPATAAADGPGNPGPTSPGNLKKKDGTVPSALLLPAVQAAREAPKSSGATKGKGNVEYTWKVERGEK
jgi:hypothetical protein